MSAPEPATDEQQRFRDLKKAWKPPKAVRRAAMWCGLIAGLAIVGYESFRAVQMLLGVGL